MLSQKALAEIKTAPLNDRYNAHRFIAEGYFKCKTCKLYIKCGSNRCPFCNRQMSRRFKTAASREKLHQFLKNPIVPAKPSRICSKCGSEKTMMKQRLRNGRYYSHWYKDGHGGLQCRCCYSKQLREALKLANPQAEA